MTSVTQPNSADINPLSQSKNFLEDGEKFNDDAVNKMANAIKNSDNLDQFLANMNGQNINQSQYSEEAATAAGSPTKAGVTQIKSPRGGYSLRLYDPFQYLNSSDEEECTFHPQINKNAHKLSKRVYTGDTNEQLYRYATERTLKKQEFAEIHHKNSTSTAYVNKTDKNSVKMILKKLQNAITNLVAGAEDEKMEKCLSFEGLGTVLHRLGIFQNLEFTSSKKDGEESSLTINYAKVKPERLAKEIAFHEQFWKICSVPTLVTDKVNSELVAKLLTVLVEEKTAVDEAGNFLTDIVNASLEAVGLKGDEEKSAFELQKEEKNLWSLQKIVVEFRQLFDNKTHFMNIYNAKKTMLSTEELHSKYYQQPHIPTTNKKSAKLDKHGWQPKFHDRLDTHHPGFTKNQPTLPSRNLRLNKYVAYLTNKKSAMIENSIKEELAPCTFVPKTKKYKKAGANRNNNDSLSPSRLEYFTHALADTQGANRHLLLYEVAKTYKEKLQQKSYVFKMKEESNEMSECSFKPKLNRKWETSPLRNQDFYEGVPRGFKKNVERLHLGTYLKETRQAELEKIPRGENYHKNKEADFNPPAHLQRPKIKKDEVLVYVDVSIGPGKTGRIGIHKGDNAKALAKNFARTYSLNQTMRESLEKLLQSYIDSYFNQPVATQQEAVEEHRQEEVEEGEVEHIDDGEGHDEHEEHHEEHEEEGHEEEHNEDDDHHDEEEN